MDVLKPFRKVVNKIKGHQEELKDKEEKRLMLERWKERLTKAMSSHDSFRADCDVRNALYNGTKATGANVSGYMSNRASDSDRPGTADARTVVNIVFQLCESQIDTSVPMPAVNAIEGDDDKDRKKMIEGMLTYMAEGPELERITSENERIVKKNGMAVIKVCYDPDYQSHKFRGRITTINPHPINIIPQSGVYKIQDMDYFFHIETRTIDYVCRRYGEEFRAELEQEGAEYRYLEDFNTSSSDTDAKDQVSVVECWYKDKDEDICLMTWANETILRDEKKFFYKRDEQGNVIEVEALEHEVLDENGNLIGIEPIQVKCRVPKKYPFVVMYNIPREKSFRGVADPDIISDQQEAIKKMLSIEEEKIIKGTTKIIVREGSGLVGKITNSILEVIETPEPQSDIRVIDLKTPDNALKDYYQLMLQAAKDSLGVTEASQGRAEGSSLSGRALEMLANNTASRLATKLFEKHTACTELYRLYYDFMVAFYDEERPYRIQSDMGRHEYGYFNKSLLVKQDDAGEWYYPEFDIFITSDVGLPRDKRFIYEASKEALGAGATDPIGFWTVMQSIGFPQAKELLDRELEKEEMTRQAELQQKQAGQPEDIISQLSPEQQQTFMQLPPEEQQAMLAQVQQQ